MKKQYQKPFIYMEEMSLASHIASCGLGSNGGGSLGRPGHQKGGCAWIDPGNKNIFTDRRIGCTDRVLPGDSADKIFCYNTPTSSTRIFAS